MAIDISNIKFHSDNHIRYEHGRIAITNASDERGHNKGANRGIQIEPNINGGEGYTVTMFNLDGNHPLWGNNVQMAPKQMKIISSDHEKIVLRGFGYDRMGGSFADYGLTIYHNGVKPVRMKLHMYDRAIDIEYFEKKVEPEFKNRADEISDAIEKLMNKNAEYDKFEPFLELEPIEFGFYSRNFKVWRAGSEVHSENSPTAIEASVVTGLFSDFRKVEISVANRGVLPFLNPINDFTYLTTQHDRILLVNLPVSDIDDTQALTMFRMTNQMLGIGSGVPLEERPQRLRFNQPFACSLFFQDQQLTKVTFSVNNPETLIEFYS